MHKLQLTEQSQLFPVTAVKKQKQMKSDKDKESSKQNQLKHMNAIKPYINYNTPGTNNKDRKLSKRDSQKNINSFSPYLPQSGNSSGHVGSSIIVNDNSYVRSKAKKMENSNKKLEENTAVGSNRVVDDLYQELNAKKLQYKSLKNAYDQKNEMTERGQKESTQLKKQIEKFRRQEDKYRKNIEFMQKQMERVKKQYIRMIETEKFKNKKLQQTIQQKQLMIAYLRSQIAALSQQNGSAIKGFYFQHTTPTYSKSNILNKQNPLEIQLKKQNELLPTQILKVPINICLQQYPPIPSVNKSMINNQSMMSSIVNNSAIQNYDMPRQLKNQQRINRNNSVINDSLINQVNKISVSKGKRQYVFASEQDSLSFSYQKSKQSVKQQQQITYKQSELQHDSISSLEDPTILTFTKKDVYVFDDDGQQIEQTNLQRAETGSQYTGQQQIMTFQNRFSQNQHSSLVCQNVHTNAKSIHVNKGFKSKNKSASSSRQAAHIVLSVGEQSGNANKSKINTRRFHAIGEQVGLQGKQYSLENKKRSGTAKEQSNSKNQKKKISRKRKSQQNGGVNIKK